MQHGDSGRSGGQAPGKYADTGRAVSDGGARLTRMANNPYERIESPNVRRESRSLVRRRSEDGQETGCIYRRTLPPPAPPSSPSVSISWRLRLLRSTNVDGHAQACRYDQDKIRRGAKVSRRRTDISDVLRVAALGAAQDTRYNRCL